MPSCFMLENNMESTSQNQLNRIQIVLVETQDAANIGACCRAMKTMGLSRLAVTGGKVYDQNRIRTLALHAFDLWEHAEKYPTIEDAVAGSILSVGATRRRGKFRKYFSLNPEQLAEKIDTCGEGLISIVFGRESDGLTDAELNLCDMAVHIPSSPDFPSLNLSQAVQVIAYTLFRSSPHTQGYQPISRTRLGEVTRTITKSFDDIHFYKQDEKEEVGRFFRDILARAGLSENEAKRLEKMFRKMAAVSRHKE
jgi:tRNA/rRNA methyltransferase